MTAGVDHRDCHDHHACAQQVSHDHARDHHRYSSSRSRSPVKTHLSLQYAHDEKLPAGYSNEVRSPDALVERFLVAHSEPGDRVFDPFAGFGTTLVTAERLGRVPYGLEYEPDRVAYVRERLDAAGNVRAGDALAFDSDQFPACDLCFTSPPFVTEAMSTDAFRNYAGESSYGSYLDDATRVVRGIRRVLKPGATVVLDVANLKHEGHVTTLAWDLADAVSEVLSFRGEVVVTWEGDGPPGSDGAYGYGYDHSYCLVFDVPESEADEPR